MAAVDQGPSGSAAPHLSSPRFKTLYKYKERVDEGTNWLRQQGVLVWLVGRQAYLRSIMTRGSMV